MCSTRRDGGRSQPSATCTRLQRGRTGRRDGCGADDSAARGHQLFPCAAAHAGTEESDGAKRTRALRSSGNRSGESEAVPLAWGVGVARSDCDDVSSYEAPWTQAEVGAGQATAHAALEQWQRATRLQERKEDLEGGEGITSKKEPYKLTNKQHYSGPYLRLWVSEPTVELKHVGPTCSEHDASE